MPEARQKTSKLADMLASASIFKACAGIAVDVLFSFMALLSFRGNPHPEPSGSRRATPPLSFQHSPGQFHEWPSVPLETVADLSGGYAFKSEEYASSGRFVLRTLNIGGDGRVNRDQAVYIPLEAC